MGKPSLVKRSIIVIAILSITIFSIYRYIILRWIHLDSRLTRVLLNIEKIHTGEIKSSVSLPKDRKRKMQSIEQNLKRFHQEKWGRDISELPTVTDSYFIKKWESRLEVYESLITDAHKEKYISTATLYESRKIEENFPREKIITISTVHISKIIPNYDFSKQRYMKAVISTKGNKISSFSDYPTFTSESNTLPDNITKKYYIYWNKPITIYPLWHMLPENTSLLLFKNYYNNKYSASEKQ